VRVVAYNVRGFRDDRRALLEVIRTLSPDVLLLNETGARWRLRRFGRELGMAVAADPWSPLRRRAKDAVLARGPWTVVEHRQVRFHGSAFLYPRAALCARLRAGGVSWLAVATHLGLRPRERARHAGELLEALARLGGPVVVGGDLNERPDGPTVAALRGRLVDAWAVAGSGASETFPAATPTARIDHVFVSHDVRVRAAFVADGQGVARASDHRPVVVDVDLPGR
jgi:endonuclease/exonuclease/phosphatase family metal-dependent hydrolase